MRIDVGTNANTQPAKPAWEMRRDMLSQRNTTRWDDAIGVCG
ncbi:DUF4113 domain-containing protein [Pseudomonas sp. KB-10]|nr:DUF4113 domain-containing protein [Pseudomonas sp. KB-10]